MSQSFQTGIFFSIIGLVFIALLAWMNSCSPGVAPSYAQSPPGDLVSRQTAIYTDQKAGYVLDRLDFGSDRCYVLHGGSHTGISCDFGNRITP